MDWFHKKFGYDFFIGSTLNNFDLILNTEANSYIMAKVIMGKNIHMQMYKTFASVIWFAIGTMIISYLLSKLRDKHCRSLSEWQKNANLTTTNFDICKWIFSPISTFSILDEMAKGQLISKGNFSVFNSPKKRTWKC